MGRVTDRMRHVEKTIERVIADGYLERDREICNEEEMGDIETWGEGQIE